MTIYPLPLNLFEKMKKKKKTIGELINIAQLVVVVAVHSLPDYCKTISPVDIA